jgi:hypothetical protein
MVWGRDLGALALYGLLTVVATWPVAPRFTTPVPAPCLVVTELALSPSPSG